MPRTREVDRSRTSEAFKPKSWGEFTFLAGTRGILSSTSEAPLVRSAHRTEWSRRSRASSRATTFVRVSGAPKPIARPAACARVKGRLALAQRVIAMVRRDDATGSRSGTLRWISRRYRPCAATAAGTNSGVVRSADQGDRRRTRRRPRLCSTWRASALRKSEGQGRCDHAARILTLSPLGN
jgi:hypothetical protein